MREERGESTGTVEPRRRCLCGETERERRMAPAMRETVRVVCLRRRRRWTEQRSLRAGGGGQDDGGDSRPRLSARLSGSGIENMMTTRRWQEHADGVEQQRFHTPPQCSLEDSRAIEVMERRMLVFCVPWPFTPNRATDIEATDVDTVSVPVLNQL